MLEFILYCGFISIVCIVLYIAYVALMYAVYRLDNGTMRFRDYIKGW